jgi:hypothetical protein
MKRTTIELSDDLYRRAKLEAAASGRTLKDLVAEGLDHVLKSPRRPVSRPTLFELMKDACGAVDSGIPDLATNKKHFADFGRDARRRNR